MKHRLFKLSGLAIAIGMQSLAVQAQAESQTVDLQSVIITGSRVQEHINEVPASVSILTQEQLEPKHRHHQ